jgi:tetratricopeptide (TPR) repeat protein
VPPDQDLPDEAETNGHTLDNAERSRSADPELRSGSLSRFAGRLLNAEKPDALKEGFKHSAHWAHPIAALFAFSTDVVKPLLPHCTVWVIILAFGALIGLIVLMRRGRIANQAAITLISFCLMTALLSACVIGLQIVVGGERDGAAAELIPGIKSLQTDLGLVSRQLQVIDENQRREAALAAARNEALLQTLGENQRQILDNFAREKGVDPRVLAPLFEALGQHGLTDEQLRVRAGEAVKAILERANQAVGPSNDGADIDAAIAAARAKLGQLDTGGARAVIADKIAREDAARKQRLVPLLVEQAAVEQLSFDYDAARATLTKLLALDPDRVWGWIDLGDIYVTTGVLDQAAKAFRQAQTVAERLAKANPGNALAERDLAVSYGRVGNVLVDQGNLADALNAYREDLAISGRLAKADPGNAVLQRDLSVSYEKVGDVQMSLGNLADALNSYREDLAIAGRLAKANPGNAGLQSDLAVSNGKVGNVLVAQRNLREALQSYRDGQIVFDQLTKADPGNAEWQRNLYVSDIKIGDILSTQDNLTAALKSYRDGQAIVERLTKADPGNAGRQRDLSVSYGRIGDVLVAQGNLPEALASYRDHLAIADRLATTDRGNAAWQHDLAVSHSKLADMYRRANDPARARQHLTEGRAIIAGLVAKFPDWAQWKNDLTWFDEQLNSLK